MFIIRNHHNHNWLDSPWWALAFLKSFAHSSLPRATFFQFLTSNILMYCSTPSYHRSFGLPTLLTPFGLVLNIFFKSSVIVHMHQVPCPCLFSDFNVINNGVSTEESVKHNSNIMLNTLLGVVTCFGP
jgi:hypothetical protein